MPTNSRYVLLTGGAGYIGSHLVLALQHANYYPIVLDNLSKGRRDHVLNAKLIVGDIADQHLLSQLFTTYPFVAVMHLAGRIDVAESLHAPQKYYQTNVAATLNLLDMVMQHQINHFIFSSSAAVYGEPHYTPLDEAHPIAPLNPYGRSKAMIETILMDYAASAPLNYAILRYFNAAGADPHARLGESHEPESHLIPLVLQAARGLRDKVIINGRDYPTPDGTCIRDYIHVLDICDAHLRVLDYLLETRTPLICNLGTAQGYSVQQVIDAAARITGKQIPIAIGARRLGDASVLVANASLAQEKLKWQPVNSTLNNILADEWRYLQKTTFTAKVVG